MKTQSASSNAAANRAAGQRILRIGDLVEKLGLSRASIYAKAASGELPSQVRIGARASGWVESEIDQWIEQRMAQGRVHRKPEAEACA